MNKEISADAPSESVSHIEAREKRVAEARRFNLLSNVFMRVVLKDKRACQYVLRILTGIPDLVVKKIRTEYRISKVTSRDVILDVLAEDGNGKIYNIEIQRTDTIDHAKRVRLYSAMVDGEYLEKGKSYAELPDLFIIYISETDLWNAGYTTYLVEKHFKHTDIAYNDGLQIMYVNAAVDDGTETARLMQYFKATDEHDMSHGDLSKRVHLLKCEEGGYQEMCEVSEKLIQEGILIGEKKGIAIGKQEGIAIGEKKGMAIGEKKGITIGETNEKMKMAFRLTSKGMAIHEIADLVETDVDTVRQWINGHSGATLQ